MTVRLAVFGLLSLSFICACSSSSSEFPGKVEYDYYYPATRQLPPEPVYSRVTWGHLPSPVGLKSSNESVFLRRTMVFELEGVSLEDAANAIAQSMGFEAVYSKTIKNRPVSMNFEGTVEEALEKLCSQTHTMAEVNRKTRTLTVFDRETQQRLLKDTLSLGQKNHP